MRDPERIDEILKKIKEIWKKNPDTRFGQLIYNLVCQDGLVETEKDEEAVIETCQLLGEDFVLNQVKFQSQLYEFEEGDWKRMIKKYKESHD